MISPSGHVLVVGVFVMCVYIASGSTPDEEWAALQQVVYSTAKTYLGKPDRKHQARFDPQRPGATDSCEQKRPSPPESCKPEAQDPPLQHTKMPADCYKHAPVH